MAKYRRFTVSVPKDLLEALDQELVRQGETRSAVIRRLLEQALRETEQEADVRRYIRGWQENPQTSEEFGWAEQVSLGALTQLPWDPTWRTSGRRP
jgi:metal-responsive CopG/Arc/MetJ family transcriptional regulator